ncbi:MAG: inorganic phosphate transporter [Rhodobacteraceae bacterium]|nr:inorganic phosphate transporter [Paracoccaceae bacterium]MCB1941163.1 inorganic phosphate transporter [Accumulibacter sp.]
MDPTIFLYLSSGLFLGWSLGANDAANVFGTAVASRMVKFRTAAIILTIGVILGAIVSGAGAAHTLSKLGAINALAGAFMVAFSAAAVVAWMTIVGLPVSTTQAVVGAIIGWNLFTGSVTDYTVFKTICATWIASPVLTGFFSYFIYKGVMKLLEKSRIHIIRLDAMTRIGLVIAGALGSYSLGANNIANVMGVFIGANPFSDLHAGLFEFSGLQQLFLLGGVAIAVGVFSYAKRVMLTVGTQIAPLTPVGAFVVIISTSLVLFLFASEGLEFALASVGLPTIPLVPVSSSQAVVGGVIGIGLIKNSRNIKWSIVGRIAVAWIQTPIVAALVCYVFLFFLQNVFGQTVYNPVEYRLSEQVVVHHGDAVDAKALSGVIGKSFETSGQLKSAIDKALPDLDFKTELKLVDDSLVEEITVDPAKFQALEKLRVIEPERLAALRTLGGRTFTYRWELVEALAEADPEWKFREKTVLNKPHNKEIQKNLDLVMDAYVAKMK